MADEKEKQNNGESPGIGPQKKKSGFVKKLIMVPLLPALTFIIAVLLFSNLFGVDLKMALNPPVHPDSVRTEENTQAVEEDNNHSGDSTLAELRKEKAELKKIKAEIDASLQKKEENIAEDLKALAKLYDSIKEDQLAYIFDHMEDTLIVKILPIMKSQKAAKVLELLDPVRAAKISRMLVVQ